MKSPNEALAANSTEFADRTANQPPLVDRLTQQQWAWLRLQSEWGVLDAVGETMADFQKASAVVTEDTARLAAILTTSAEITQPKSPRTAPTKPLRQAPCASRTTTRGTPPGTIAMFSAMQQQAWHIAAKADNLEQLRAAIDAFDGCPLKTTASQVVFGVGVEQPKVMIIGEGPGSEEDRVGVPFVGASGRLIQRCLAVIGINTEENLYITNSVYWRPPADRMPTDTEVAACMPFVARQIQLLQPKIIVLVGARAAQSFLGVKSGITRLRGGWYSLMDGLIAEDIPAFAIFHPAYLFRNHAQKKMFWRDIWALRQRLDEMQLDVPWPQNGLTSFDPEWHPQKPDKHA